MFESFMFSQSILVFWYFPFSLSHLNRGGGRDIFSRLGRFSKTPIITRNHHIPKWSPSLSLLDTVGYYFFFPAVFFNDHEANLKNSFVAPYFLLLKFTFTIFPACPCFLRQPPKGDLQCSPKQSGIGA